MKPHKDDRQQSHEARKDQKQHRFQIVKLEERIAPGCSAHYNPKGKYVGHYCYRR